MVFQTWEELPDNVNVMPDSVWSEATVVLAVLRGCVVDLGHTKQIDFKVMHGQLGVLDGLQRECAKSNAMPSQQDLEELRQRLEDLIGDVVLLSEGHERPTGLKSFQEAWDAAGIFLDEFQELLDENQPEWAESGVSNG